MAARTSPWRGFADNGAVLENPGMGWVFHHYDNALETYGPPLGPGYVAADFPGCTVVYLRRAVVGPRAK